MVRRLLDEVSAALGDDQRRLLDAATGDDPRRAELAIGALCDPIHARILRAVIRDTFSPDVIHAGTKYNVIPGDATVEVDIRPLPGTTPDDIREEILARLGDLVPVCELEHIHSAIPFEMPVDDVYELLADTIRAADPDGVPVPMLAPFATDGKHLVRLGVPVYGFSPLLQEPGEGFLDNFHSVDERVGVESLRWGLPGPVRRDRHLLRLTPAADRSRGPPVSFPPRTSRPRRLIAWVASAATPIAISARSPRGIGRTADRNCSARARSTIRSTAWPRGVSHTERSRPSSSSRRRSTSRRLTSPSTSRDVADGERPIASARSATVVVEPSARTYSAASWVNPRLSSPSCEAKPTTSSRHSARPIATRSEIWRTFWIRVPAATTGAERSASKTRAMTRDGAALRRRVRVSASGSAGPAAGSLGRGRRARGVGTGWAGRSGSVTERILTPPERRFGRRFLQACTQFAGPEATIDAYPDGR